MKTKIHSEEFPRPAKTILAISVISALMVTVIIFSLKLIETALSIFSS